MAALEGRVSRVEREVSHLQGGYEHLATKADLANLENRLIKWMVGLGVGVVVSAGMSALTLILRLVS